MIMVKKLIQVYLNKKPYLRTNYIEAKIEQDIDFKKQNRIKNLPDPIFMRESTSKNYVDNKFNDPSIIKKIQIMLTSLIKISIMFNLLE